MMMAKERAILKAQDQLAALVAYIEQAVAAGLRIDQVEREFFGRLLNLGLTLLEAFVASQGDGDAGSEVETADGRRVRRMPELHERRYLSIFGELLIRRWVYAEREKRPVERAPLDERLGLPAGEFSYVLADWLQRLCVKESFHEAVQDLREWLGVAPSEAAAERMNQELSKQVERFGVLDEPPPTEQEGEILVATADGKGCRCDARWKNAFVAARGGPRERRRTRNKWPTSAQSIRLILFAARPMTWSRNGLVASGPSTGPGRNRSRSGRK